MYMGKKTNPFLCLLFYLFSLKIFTTKMATAQVIPIKVGVVLDTDDYGEMTINCISMAVSDFYATHGHYKTRLVLTNRDSKGDVVGAAAAALDLLKNVQVQAIIGPTYSVQANFLISLGNKSQVPIITFSATSPVLSSIRSPYFIRATLNDSSQVDAIAALIEVYGWREVVPIYEDNEFGEGMVPYLTDALEQANARVPYRSVISPQATDDQIVAELYKIMTMQTRVFVVHMLSPLASRLFTKAKQLGMMSKEYAWIITDGITNELNSMDPSVIESMLGVIGVRPYTPKTKELDDFVTRYKNRVRQNNPRATTPDPDIFGLWAYDSITALAMAAEEARLTNPQYIMANISKNSTDLEAFGVSNAGSNLIQALSKITFKGLAGSFDLVDGELQAPPFQIVNMVGPGARGIGYWTKENGTVKELNFTSTDSTSISKLGTTIWPGDTSSSPKGWVIPTNGKTLKVGVPVKPGYTEFVRVTWNSDNSATVEGFCIDVFDAVMAALPYGVPYEYIPFATPDHTMAGSYDELVHQVYLGNYDAVAGDVTIVGNRSKYVDFTLPYTESGVSMIVPIKDEGGRNTAWEFLKPLTWELWLTSFCSFVFIGFLIWILEHRINEDFRGPFWHQVGMIFWFAFSTMVFAQKEKVLSNLSRFVLIIWFLVVLILTQSYTASLASMLTVQKLQPTVTDVNDLIRNKESVGYMNGSFIYELLQQKNFAKSQLQPFNSPDQLNELLSNGSISAAFHEIPYIKLFLAGKYGSNYTMVGPLYKADGFGFVFPIGSPLVPDVSRAILNVTEGPKMTGIEREWLGDNTKYPDCNSLSNSAKNLPLASFWGLFLIVAIAGLVALVIFVIRFLHENWSAVEDLPSTQSKVEELLKLFDKKDLKSYTFRNLTMTQRYDDYGSGDCMDMTLSLSPQQNPSTFSLPSPRTTGPPSPVLSTPAEQNINLPEDDRSIADNAMTSHQGEPFQTINQEKEIEMFPPKRG